MDIIEWIITTILILFGLIGVPFPYGKIGKKLKKNYSWSRGLLTIIYDRFYVKGNVLDPFVYFIEEFDNFANVGSTLSFPSMYRDLIKIGLGKFTKMEDKHIHDKIEKVETSYFKVKNIQKLRRKKVFKHTVREFKDLVEEISKMARDVSSIIKDKNILRSTTNQEYVDRFKFSAREFNNFLRHFRSFLDKTYCYHEVEIEQYRLMQLLIPEEIEFIKEVRHVL